MAGPRVALVGCGRWGRHILRDLLSLGADVVVVVPSERTRAFALDHGASAAVDDVGRLGSIDGAVVATPTSTHADVVDRLLPLGCPLFVEKPLTSSVERARQILERGGERVFVMDKWRYHPGIRKLAELAREGMLGEVRSIRISRLGWSNPHRDVDSLWILLPHDLSIALHILGSLPPLTQAISLSGAIDDRDVLVCLQETGGPMVTIETSIVSPETKRSFTVIGTRKTAQLTNSYEAELHVRDGAPGAIDAEASVIPADGPLPLLAELESFLGHLRGGPAPLSSAADAVLVVERIAEIRKRLGLS